MIFETLVAYCRRVDLKQSRDLRLVAVPIELKLKVRARYNDVVSANYPCAPRYPDVRARRIPFLTVVAA